MSGYNLNSLTVLYYQDRDGSDDQDMASDLRMARDHPFSFPHLGPLPGLPALEALNKQQKELLGSNIILPTSSPQGLLKAHSNLFPSHHGFPPLRPPSQVQSLTSQSSLRVTKHKSNPNCFTANAKQSVQQPFRLRHPAELEL